MIRKNKMQHLIELAQDGSVVDSAITDAEAEYLRRRGFKVEKNKYSVLGKSKYSVLYRIQKKEEK